MAENGGDEIYKASNSFYDKYVQVDENIQAKIKPVLNQIHESRVAIKELHIQYGIKFSEIIPSYQTRLQDLNTNYETLMSEMNSKKNNILQLSAELLKKK